MNIKKGITLFITSILVLIVLLLLIDIFTGIWYWNRLNLKYSSSTFNNILTPMTGVLAIMVYSYTLKVTIRQNKTINSFTHKETLLKEVPRLKERYENNIFNIDKEKSINTVKFLDEVILLLSQLNEDKQYIEDTKYPNIKFTIEEIEKKSYYRYFLAISLFISKNRINCFYHLQIFVSEILESDLVLSHKKYIIKEIENEILHDYLYFSAMISYSNKYSNKKFFNYYILDNDIRNEYFNNMDLTYNELYSWKSLNETEILDFYNWYIWHLKRAGIKSLGN